MKNGMSRGICRWFFLLSLLALVSATPVIINDDAGWSWFEDERAVFAGNRLVARIYSLLPQNCLIGRTAPLTVQEFDKNRDGVITLGNPGPEDRPGSHGDR